MSSTSLTQPQLALLAEVRAKGTVVKNGRIRKTAEALQRAGLVTTNWWPVPNAMGVPSERWEITIVNYSTHSKEA